MKIDAQHHYELKDHQQQQVVTGLCSLMQLYATDLNFHELCQGLNPEAINWEYLELFLMEQLELHPTSAAQEANFEYFETLKQLNQKQK